MINNSNLQSKFNPSTIHPASININSRRSQQGGTNDDARDLLMILNSITNNSILKFSDATVAPILNPPPNIKNSITWKVNNNNNLVGYAYTRDSKSIAEDGGKQLLVTNFTVKPILNYVSYVLLSNIIKYAVRNNYSYLLIEPPTEFIKFNNKYNNFIIWKL